MTFTLTLVASNPPLTAQYLQAVRDFGKANHLPSMGEVDWLNPDKAADMPLGEELTLPQMKTLREFLSEEKIDVFCTRTENRRKKLLMADMDATIVTSETLDDLAEKAGIGAQVAAITKRAMEGEIDFEGAIRERVGLLTGRPESELTDTFNDMEISAGAATLVRTMKDNTAKSVLVSGGFTFFTQKVAEKLGFYANHGNTLGIKDGKLTGTVEGDILGKEAKVRFLQHYTKELGLGTDDSVAIGDGANDLPMLQTAGLGIGYHPKPKLQENLINQIHYTDLTSVLYAQGYKASEFTL